MLLTQATSQTKKARTVRGTHIELTDTHLRLILANELLVLRSIAKNCAKKGYPMSTDYLFAVQVGLDTFARRVEDVEKNGMQVTYKQNYSR